MTRRWAKIGLSERTTYSVPAPRLLNGGGMATSRAPARARVRMPPATAWSEQNDESVGRDWSARRGQEVHARALVS
jgi:hypothetical protein